MTKGEQRKIYKHIPFTPKKWREQAKNGKTPTGEDGKALPQGIVVGCTGNTTAMVDTGDVHVLMIGAAGVGKTAFWLYPCIEYACASGMSFLSTDTKGDVMRNYGSIAKGYGYNVSVIDLRNPTRSNGNNLLHLVNKVRVWFDREYAKDSSPYLAIFCRVRKKDVPKFLAALEDLKNSMMLCGHPHYVEEISSYMDEMEKMKGALHGNENDAAQETEQKRTA